MFKGDFDRIISFKQLINACRLLTSSLSVCCIFCACNSKSWSEGALSLVLLPLKHLAYLYHHRVRGPTYNGQTLVDLYRTKGPPHIGNLASIGSFRTRGPYCIGQHFAHIYRKRGQHHICQPLTGIYRTRGCDIQIPLHFNRDTL